MCSFYYIYSCWLQSLNPRVTHRNIHSVTEEREMNTCPLLSAACVD